MEFETTTETNSVKNTVEIFWLRRGQVSSSPADQSPGFSNTFYVTGRGRGFVSTRKWSSLTPVAAAAPPRGASFSLCPCKPDHRLGSDPWYLTSEPPSGHQDALTEVRATYTGGSVSLPA